MRQVKSKLNWFLKSASVTHARGGHELRDLRHWSVLTLKLFFLGRSRKRANGSLAGRDGGGESVEIASPDKPLMLHRSVAKFIGHLKFALLQLGIGRHAQVGILPRQLEGGEVQRV